MSDISIPLLDYVRGEFARFRSKKLREQSEEQRYRQESMNTQCYLSNPKRLDQITIYFCGLKPYGIEGKTYKPADLPKGHFAYLDESLYGPFASRAVTVLAAITPRYTLRTSVFLTNWFWQRAKDSKQLKDWNWTVEDMIPFHRMLLKELNPKIVLCVGNGQAYSSFAGMCQLYGIPSERVKTTEYHNRLKLKYCSATDQLIVGIPHLSRTFPDAKMLNWLTQLLDQ